MKNTLLIILGCLWSLVAVAHNKDHNERHPGITYDILQQVTYTCPMHPEIHATKPGNCPKCGMKLVKEKPKPVKRPVTPKKDPVPVKVDTTISRDSWTCPMHPEIHSPKPGKCPKCGMALVKEKVKPVLPAEPKDSISKAPVTPGQNTTWTCPMHPEIHADKPGNCPKCGMKLVEEKKPGQQEENGL
jgi:hypothetical protein